MSGYGEFCAIAKGAEVLCERWTPLVVRELLCGSTRYSEIKRGIPRISPTMLSKRLRSLREAGVVRRGADDTWHLTEAGRELYSVIEALGAWGQRWVRDGLADDELDPDAVMWDIRRRVVAGAVPGERTVLQFHLRDAAPDRRSYWLLVEHDSVELCLTAPGPVDLKVLTDVRTLIEVWMGDRSLHASLTSGALECVGDREVRRALPEWFTLNPLARVPRPA